ncbi:MAG: hypothetical protein GFH27_549285n266 [Chloroflexi bacterium AL-W]|nr:hypothetical protein [Chloroflexi bacterium AL-N1]NOK65778.1 hypothetical protein [Chloroflexi bacterium AL-N10]NOK74281.1 hypothetical protein [Chloroflexi bacterium AL-N5]NOK80811.1 hypothetical protein [Chloroflexi bacterium AL-W]NOK88539.1 hypothetical protein [Chloroflexi bacterium AL-N15]
MDWLFEANTSLYVALFVTLWLWIGLFSYLWRVDRRSQDIQRRIDSLPVVDQQVITPQATLELRKPDQAVTTPDRQPIRDT